MLDTASGRSEAPQGSAESAADIGATIAHDLRLKVSGRIVHIQSLRYIEGVALAGGIAGAIGRRSRDKVWQLCAAVFYAELDSLQVSRPGDVDPFFIRRCRVVAIL